MDSLKINQYRLLIDKETSPEIKVYGKDNSTNSNHTYGFISITGKTIASILPILEDVGFKLMKLVVLDSPTEVSDKIKEMNMLLDLAVDAQVSLTNFPALISDVATPIEMIFLHTNTDTLFKVSFKGVVTELYGDFNDVQETFISILGAYIV